MSIGLSRRGPRGRRDAVRLAATAARILLHAVARGVAGMLPRAGGPRLPRACAAGRCGGAAIRAPGTFGVAFPAGVLPDGAGGRRGAGAKVSGRTWPRAQAPRSSTSRAAAPAMRARKGARAARPGGHVAAERRTRAAPVGGAAAALGADQAIAGTAGAPPGPGNAHPAARSGAGFRHAAGERARGGGTRLHFCAGIPAEKHIIPRAGA